jgi:hypothetical protein
MVLVRSTRRHVDLRRREVEAAYVRASSIGENLVIKLLLISRALLQDQAVAVQVVEEGVCIPTARFARHRAVDPSGRNLAGAIDHKLLSGSIGSLVADSQREYVHTFGADGQSASSPLRSR